MAGKGLGDWYVMTLSAQKPRYLPLLAFKERGQSQLIFQKVYNM